MIYKNPGVNASGFFLTMPQTVGLAAIRSLRKKLITAK